MVTEYMSLRHIERLTRIKIREWPTWLGDDEGEFTKWRGTLSEKEWDRHTATIRVPEMKHNIFTHEEEWTGEWVEAEEAHNLLTNVGVVSALRNWTFGSTGQLWPLTQIMSVGNVAVTGVARTDTTVPGDAFATGARHIPNTTTITGFQGDIGVNFATTDAVGTWLSGGWYGYLPGSSQNATTTAGTGQVNTRFMLNYVKSNSLAVTLDYVFVLQN